MGWAKLSHFEESHNPFSQIRWPNRASQSDDLTSLPIIEKPKYFSGSDLGPTRKFNLQAYRLLPEHHLSIPFQKAKGYENVGDGMITIRRRRGNLAVVEALTAHLFLFTYFFFFFESHFTSSSFSNAAPI